MVLKNMRVAVTGAFGTLGTAVVGRVLAEGGLVAAIETVKGAISAIRMA